MDQKPLISIIIPSYNSSQTVIRTLESIFSQNYENIEVLLIDNGSIDNTKEIVEKRNFRNLTIFTCARGRSRARNVGLEKARGKYINFIDADDSFNNNHLMDGVEFLEKHAEFDMYVDQAEFIKNDKNLGLVTNFADKKGKDLLNGNFFVISSPLFRKTAVSYLFDEMLDYNEDWLFWAQNFSSKNLFFEEKKVGSFIYITGENTMLDIGMPISMGYVLSKLKKGNLNFDNILVLIKSILLFKTLSELEKIKYGHLGKIIKYKFPLMYLFISILVKIPGVNYLISKYRKNFGKKSLYK